MFTDFILNEGGSFVGSGALGTALADVRFDPGMLRPYFDQKGDRCVTMNTGRFSIKEGRKIPVLQKVKIGDLIANGIYSPVFNATTLRKDEWQLMDQVVLKTARERLKAWGDLASRSSFSGFNGMGKTVLEHETMSDPGEALVDMDGLTEGRSDTPRFQLEGLPLPITHADFWFSQRRLMASRNSGMPLDTTMGEAATRRVTEKVEQTLIGTVTGLTYGNSTDYGTTSQVYGYTNYPNRLTKTNLTTPTGSNPDSTVSDVLAMRDQLADAKHYGPYMLYHSTDWDQYMDNDYVTGTAAQGLAAPSSTLRSRLKSIDGITDVKRLDFLTSTFTLIMVQMTPDVVRAVNGLDITTVQWESMGGLRINFKVMAIMVPQIRSDFSGNCGLLHATTS